MASGFGFRVRVLSFGFWVWFRVETKPPDPVPHDERATPLSTEVSVFVDFSVQAFGGGFLAMSPCFRCPWCEEARVCGDILVLKQVRCSGGLDV